MEFVQEKKGDVLVARLSAVNVTSHEAPELKTSLLALLMGEPKKILLNLSQVRTMDSTGLGALLFAIRQAERYQKDIRFCEMQSKVQFLIRIAHLEEVIDVYETEAEALKDFEEDQADAGTFTG
jgi:anti-sigma B factor antagonist